MMTSIDKKALAQLSVLIVDEQPLITKLITVVLGSLGVHTVTTTTDGADAFRKMDAATEPFGLVICDWMMPGMDGITFLKKFRAADKDTPFVMLTAKSVPAEFRAAKRAGTTYFLMKPLEHEELEMRLQAVMEATVLSG